MLPIASTTAAPSGAIALLRLLQLASPALPVGAFSYSEGLETLVFQQRITTPAELAHWLEQELSRGSIALDGALMLRCHGASQTQDWQGLLRWNDWSSASRETEELRQQSEQMGRSLLRLLLQLTPPPTLPTPLSDQLRSEGCNFCTAFGLAAAHWAIPQDQALLGYLQSWATNLVAAAIKLVPLGQTVGQQLLFDLQPTLERAAQALLVRGDGELETCGWGLSLASMAHAGQYSRLFRS